MYPLVISHMELENPPFLIGESTIMAMFHCFLRNYRSHGFSHALYSYLINEVLRIDLCGCAVVGKIVENGRARADHNPNGPGGCVLPLLNHSSWWMFHIKGISTLWFCAWCFLEKNTQNHAKTIFIYDPCNMLHTCRRDGSLHIMDTNTNIYIHFDVYNVHIFIQYMIYIYII